MRVLDLCAGTGSATKAFFDRGHEVETLDITGNHTYVCDVRSFIPEKKYDFIWASPPCTEFSLADYRKGKCKDRKPDLSIVETCFRICKTAEYWIIENPRGCLRHFIGNPTITIKYSEYGHKCVKPTDLWGVFPFFFSTAKRQKTKSFKYAYPGHNDPRGEIPYNLSLVICKALEREHLV